MATRTISTVLVVAALAVGAGCARSDWIQRTLVTVDVTGTWESSDEAFGFKLEQRGANVTGSVLLNVADFYRPGGGIGGAGGGRQSGPIEGNVSGDVFRFKQTGGFSAGWEGEMTVNGDEMTGSLRAPTGTQRSVVVRRATSSVRPATQP